MSSNPDAAPDAMHATTVQQLAEKLESLQKHVRRTAVPSDFILSKVPRVRIPVDYGADDATRVTTWSDLYAKNTQNTRNKARIALIVNTLASSTAAESAGSASGSFESPYAWLEHMPGMKSREERRLAQRDALRLLGVKARKLRKGEQKMPEPVQAFAEGNRAVWFFFVDGRVNFSDLLQRAALRSIDEQHQGLSSLLADCARPIQNSRLNLLRVCGGSAPGDLFADFSEEAQFTHEYFARFAPTAQQCEAVTASGGGGVGFDFFRLALPKKAPNCLGEWPVPFQVHAYVDEKVALLRHGSASSTGAVQRVLQRADVEVDDPLLPLCERSSGESSTSGNGAASASADEQVEISYAALLDAQEARINQMAGYDDEDLQGASLLDVAAEQDLFAGDVSGEQRERNQRNAQAVLSDESFHDKLKRRYIFQELRERYGVEQKKIEKTYVVGTPDYNDAKSMLFQKQGAEFVHGFFHSERVSEPVMKTRRHWTKSSTVQIPEYSIIDNEISAYANYKLHKYLGRKVAFTPGSQQELLSCMETMAMSGSAYDLTQSCVLCIAGDTSTGKSHAILSQMAQLPPGVGKKYSYATEKADLNEDDELDVVNCFEEAPLMWFGIGPNGQRVPVEGHIKDKFTSNILAVKTMQVRKDPDTGEVTRQAIKSEKLYKVATIIATNEGITGREDALIQRFFIYTMNAATSKYQRVVDRMEAPDYSNMKVQGKHFVDSEVSFNCLVMFVLKAIESKLIAAPNMDSFSEMKELLSYVENTYSMQTDKPKSLKKMHMWCYMETVRYATHMAACSELGREFRRFPDGSPHRLEKEPELALRLLQLVEKFLVLTREIVVYVFSMMRSEWMDKTFQAILQTIHYMYLADRECVPPGLPSRRPKFLSPKASRLHTDLGVSKDLLVDQSYMVIEASGSKQSYNTIATTLHKFIEKQGEAIPLDDITRALKTFAKRQVSTPIYYLPASGTIEVDCDHSSSGATTTTLGASFNPDMPQQYADPQTHEKFHQTLEMAGFFSADSDLGDGDEDVAAAPPFGGGGGFRNSSFGMHKQMRFAVLTDLVRNPHSSEEIINNAVRSLGHANQQRERPKYITSLPIVIDDPEAFLTDADSTTLAGFGAKRKRKHPITIHDYPAVVEVKWTNRLRGVPNPQPMTPHMQDYFTLFSEGERGQVAQRACPVSTSGSAAFIIDLEPDIAAMQAHHTRCGYEYDKSIHPSELMKRLIPMRQTLLPGRPFLHLRDMVKNDLKMYLEREAAETLFAHEFKSNAHRQAVEKMLERSNVGMLSHTINAARQLTDDEVSMRLTRDDIHASLQQKARTFVQEVRASSERREMREDGAMAVEAALAESTATASTTSSSALRLSSADADADASASGSSSSKESLDERFAALRNITSTLDTGRTLPQSLVSSAAEVRAASAYDSDAEQQSPTKRGAKRARDDADNSATDLDAASNDNIAAYERQERSVRQKQQQQQQRAAPEVLPYTRNATNSDDDDDAFFK